MGRKIIFGVTKEIDGKLLKRLRRYFLTMMQNVWTGNLLLFSVALLIPRSKSMARSWRGLRGYFYRYWTTNNWLISQISSYTKNCESFEFLIFGFDFGVSNNWRCLFAEMNKANKSQQLLKQTKSEQLFRKHTYHIIHYCVYDNVERQISLHHSLRSNCFTQS